MGICIGLFDFKGPGLQPEELNDQPGVYVILHYDHQDGQYELIDVGHDDSLSERGKLLNMAAINDRHPGSVSLAVHYTDVCGSSRTNIVEAIEWEFEYRPKAQLQLTEAVC